MSERVHPPTTGGEREQLLGFLQLQRDTLRLKAGDLDAAQLATTLPPSTMTLGGMVKHLAFVESWWLRDRFSGDGPIEPWASADWKADPDWEWHSAADDTPEQIWALYDAMVADADTVLAGAGLEDRAARTSHGRELNLRWILLHLVEEYARHLGHADLIRESIDGRTGD